MTGKEGLIADIRAMGIGEGDTVLIHSSMRAIGGRADDLLDAFCEVLTERGLLVLPTLSWSVSELDDPVFDVLHTPSQVGILPEIFRRRPQVFRSWHPTHSVAAWGRDAEAFTGGAQLTHSPCAFSSPWHRLLDRDAIILQAGCTLTSCTFLHGVEEWNEVPGHLGKPVNFKVIPPSGGAFRMWSCPHEGTPSEQFGLAEKTLADAGALQYARLGRADTMRLSARMLCEVVSGMLKENKHLFDDPRE